MNKKMKKLVITLSVILVVVLLLSFVGPQIVLSSARQPEVETDFVYNEYFRTLHKYTSYPQ